MRHGVGHERRIDQAPHGVIGRTGRQVGFGDFVGLLERAAFEFDENFAVPGEEGDGGVRVGIWPSWRIQRAGWLRR